MRGALVCFGLAMLAVGLLYTVNNWIMSGPAGWTPDGAAVLAFVGWMVATVASLWDVETITEDHPDALGSLDRRERAVAAYLNPDYLDLPEYDTRERGL